MKGQLLHWSKAAPDPMSDSQRAASGPIRPRERCTVGALRAEAADVDVEIKSMGRRKAEGGAEAAQLLARRAGGQGKD